MVVATKAATIVLLTSHQSANKTSIDLAGLTAHKISSATPIAVQTVMFAMKIIARENVKMKTSTLILETNSISLQ